MQVEEVLENKGCQIRTNSQVDSISTNDEGELSVAAVLSCWHITIMLGLTETNKLQAVLYVARMDQKIHMMLA